MVLSRVWKMLALKLYLAAIFIFWASSRLGYVDMLEQTRLILVLAGSMGIGFLVFFKDIFKR